MMLRIASAIFLVAFTGATQAPLRQQPFAYADLGLETDWQAMAAKYPHSSQEFWETSTGKIYLLESDGAPKFQQAVRSGSGRYRIRVSQDEARDGVYFIELQITGGKAQSLKLSFEKPEALVKNQDANFDDRYPPCAPLLASFTTRFGKHQKSRSWSEEALEQTERTWSSSEEQASVVCGQYYGRKKVFALELTIAR